MSILETMFFIFDSDAKGLNRGVDEADRKTKTLEKDLMNVDGVASTVGDSLLSIARSAGAAIGGFLAFSSLAHMTREVADFTDELNDSAEAIGVNISSLQAWDQAAKLTGGQNGAFIGSLKSFNEGVTSIAVKGKGLLLPFFNELGLSLDDIKKKSGDPLALLEELSDQFVKLSAPAAAAIGSKLGLDQGTINLLRQGREGLRALVDEQERNGVVSKEQAEIAAKFNDELDSLNFSWQDLKRRIIIDALPALTWVVDALRTTVNWVKDHKEAVVTFITVTATALAVYYAPAALAAAAATWALIGPFVLVGAAIAAVGAVIALVAEDLYNFQQGNDSAIGELAKKWPWIGELIHQVGEVLAWLIELFVSFGQLVAGVFTEPEKAIEQFSDRIDKLVADIAEKFPRVGQVFEAVTGLITLQIQAAATAWDWFADKVTKGVAIFQRVADFIKSMHGAGLELFGAEPTDTAKEGRASQARRAAAEAGQNEPPRPAPAARLALGAANAAEAARTATAAGAAREAIAPATVSNIGATTSTAITNANTSTTRSAQVTTGPITVNTQASDGEGVSKALANNLSTHIQSAIDQTDDGVAA